MLKTFEVNTLGRDFVCGDLHGCHSFLLHFLQEIDFNFEKDRMFSVGDLIDRGPESFRCLSMIQEPWFHAVKGNHEDLMIEFLKRRPLRQWWFPNGGSWWKDINEEEQNIVKGELLPLVEKLPMLITVNMSNGKKFHVIHAEFGATISVSDEILADFDKLCEICDENMGDGHAMIWGRNLFGGLFSSVLSQPEAAKVRRRIDLEKADWHFAKDMGQVFSGHTIVSSPTTISKQTNLDTGAFAAGGKHKHEWPGLTVCEPLTGKFWRTTDLIFEETKCLII